MPILLVVALGAAVATTIYLYKTMPDTPRLNKVPLPGERYFHRFLAGDGTMFEVEATKDQYKDLAKSNPVNPTHPNGTWVCSYSGYRLNNNEWCEESAEKILVALNGRVFPLEAGDVQDDKLTTKGQETINKHLNNPNGNSI